MPAGDSPGTSTSRPRRVRQSGLAQPSPNQDGTSGNAQAAGSVSARSSSRDQPGVGVRGVAVGRAALPAR